MTLKSIHQNLEHVSSLNEGSAISVMLIALLETNEKKEVHYHSKRNGKLNQDLPTVVVKQSWGSDEAVWDDLSCLKCM